MPKPKFTADGHPIVQHEKGKLFYIAHDEKTRVEVDVPEGFRVRDHEADGWELVPIHHQGEPESAKTEEAA